MTKARFLPNNVYWLYDPNDPGCFDPRHHGRIGLTAHLRAREAAHRYEAQRGTNKGAAGLPNSFKLQVLFHGSFDECALIEAALRPPGTRIGWNRAGGGQRSCLGYKHTAKTRQNMSIAARKSGHQSRPKTAEWRANMSAAARARYLRPGERDKTIAAVKKAFQMIDRSGANNAMFGKVQSEETKQKIRIKIDERGGIVNPVPRGTRRTDAERAAIKAGTRAHRSHETENAYRCSTTRNDQGES